MMHPRNWAEVGLAHSIPTKITYRNFLVIVTPELWFVLNSFTYNKLKFQFTSVTGEIICHAIEHKYLVGTPVRKQRTTNFLVSQG
jgi:hypothetical protein